MYEYRTYEVYTCEVAGVIDSESYEGWRLTSAFPTGKPVYYEERGCQVMLILEKVKSDGNPL